MEDFLTDLIEQTSPPSVIYHYTNQEGLLGIVLNSEIWASKFKYLNDTSELIHSLEQFASMLDEIPVDNHNGPTIKDLIDRSKNTRSLNMCVCSFTENGDLLSQWRAYGGTSSGYAIGFDSKALKTSAEKHDFFLAKCIYDPVQQSDIIKKFAIHALAEVQNERITTEAAMQEFCKIACLMKNSHFKEEQEWRLICGPQSCMLKEFRFRSGKTNIVPYFSIPIGIEYVDYTAEVKSKPPIKYVICGPTIYPELAKDAATFVLIKSGLYLNETELINSAIPFRN
jgi:hypothetical protein